MLRVNQEIKLKKEKTIDDDRRCLDDRSMSIKSMMIDDDRELRSMSIKAIESEKMCIYISNSTLF